MGKLYVFMGPPASGKTAIIRKLSQYRQVSVIVGCTNRPKRDYEIEGVDYYFKTKEDFGTIHFAERTNYLGYGYGIEWKELEKKVQLHDDGVAVVEHNCLDSMKKFFGGRVESIYMMVDDITMIDRMLQRGQNNDEIIKTLSLAEQNGDFDGWKTADYIVKNTKEIEVTMRQVLAIIGIK